MLRLDLDSPYAACQRLIEFRAILRVVSPPVAVGAYSGYPARVIRSVIRKATKVMDFQERLPQRRKERGP